jgi:hypothetical protein
MNVHLLACIPVKEDRIALDERGRCWYVVDSTTLA